MADGVDITVKSQLTKVIADLEKIQAAGDAVSDQFKRMGDDVGKNVKGNTKQVETGLQKLQGFGRRVADQLRQDFASLASIQSLSAGLKLSNQFGGSIKEAVSLSDTVRRLGSIFGIAQKDFASFQTDMQKGLAGIGASSEAAANALGGLAETPVRGKANLIEYAKIATQLASVSGQKGQEGTVAKGLAGVITARGGNPNDVNQARSASTEILQIRQATGKSVTEITQALTDIYAKTNKDFQGRLKGGGSTTLAAASLSAGPQSTAFLEKYLGMNRIERKGLEAQGFGEILKQNGQVNSSAILRTLQEAKGRGLGDAQAGLKTYGFSDDEAKGFIRLAEAVKSGGDAINGAKNAQVSLNAEYAKSMSLGDSFRASINKLKGAAAPLISSATQGITDALGKASQTTGGAIAVTAGAAGLAAILSGRGLQGLGGGLLGGALKSKAIEGITGEKVQKVEVINFPAGFGAAGVAGGGGIAALLGKGVAVAGAGAAGYGAGDFARQKYESYVAANPDSQTAQVDRKVDSAIESFFLKIGPKLGLLPALAEPTQKVKDANYGPQPAPQRVDVTVDLKSKDLKSAPAPGRGVSR